jgi:phospholipase/lecithinase/hemolysin
MAPETAPSRIVYFGDSLSDRGLLFELTGRVLKVPVPPESAGYVGWFSNGEVQSGYTPALLGVDSEVFAIGGARAVGSGTVGEYVEQYIARFGQPDILLPNPDPAALQTDRNLTAQVDRFISATGSGGAAAGTAAVIFIGANDYNGLFADPTRPPTPEEVGKMLFDVLSSISSATQKVLQTGVEQVLLYNLPDATFFPPPPGVDPALIEAGNLVVQQHNERLADVAQGFRDLGADVQIVDINRITDEITADPQTFGFRPEFVDEPALLGIATQPFWLEAQDAWFIPPNPDVAGVDPDQLLFFDFLHPTTATHGVIGAFAAESLTSTTHLLGGGDDTVTGGRADDLVLAGGGADRVLAGRGADVVLAGRGGDLVDAGDGDDIVAGGAGGDWLDGGEGNDVVGGSSGSDIARGGRGDDLLVDGLGWDVLLGERGDDAFLYVEAALQGGRNASDGGAFFGGAGEDTLYLALSPETEANVLAELAEGEAHNFASIGLVSYGIENFIFVPPTEPAVSIDSPARVAEADIWGIV